MFSFLKETSIFPLNKKVHVYFYINVCPSSEQESPCLLLQETSMSRNVITRKNVLHLIDRRNVVVKPRRRLALAHRSTQIWQHVWHDRRGVRLGDAITQRRVITFWR